MQPFKAQSEIAFAIQTGADVDSLKEQFGLDDVEARHALEYYEQGNDLELVKLAQSKTILTPAANTGDLITPEVQDLPAPPPPTHGYVPTPRGPIVFIRPLPKDHSARLITPPAYETNGDMGFVYAAAPTAKLNPGTLVLYDKFAEVGNKYDMVEDGEIVELVAIREEFILATLTRVKL